MSYAGASITIPFGQHGIISDLGPTELPITALIDAKNVILTGGRVQKAPGARAYNETPLASAIVALVDWWPATITQRMIVACENGNLYRDNGTGSFAFNGGLPLNPVPLTGLNPNCQFIRAGEETAGRVRKLFFLSRAQNQVQVLTGDGDEFEPINLPAADWATGNFPRCGVLHRNSLWVFSGQMSYASDTGDHENFTSGLVFADPVFPGEGGDIIGAFVFRSRLFCFKEDNYAYWLDDSDSNSDNWIWKQLNASFGLSGTNSIVSVLNDMLAGNSTATVTSYTATDNFGDIDAADIFKAMGVETFMRENTSDAGIELQHAVYYSKKKQIFFTYRSAYFNENNMLAVIDMNEQAPRFTYYKKGVPSCLALRKDSTGIRRPMYGSTDGRIYIMDRENRREGDVAYEGMFQTIHMDMRQVDPAFANKTKLFDWLAVTYIPEGDFELSCEYFIDGRYIDTIQFPMRQYTKPQLDVLFLGSNRLAQSNTETSTRKLSGSGRTISFRFLNSGIDESFQVPSITVGFRPSGEQAQKNGDT